MTNQTAANRRTPLLTDRTTAIPREKRRLGEVAGGTAAECAAVCCCCPCAVMNVVVLALYKVPTGLWRKAWTERRKQQQLARRRNLIRQRPSGLGGGGGGGSTREDLEAELNKVKEAAGASDFLEDQIMWDRFSGTGFWRSPSQRES